MKQLITGIIIGMLIIGLGVGIYFGYQYEKSKWLNQGYEAGTFYTAQTGIIRYVENSTGTPLIKTLTLQEVCNPQQ